MSRKLLSDLKNDMFKKHTINKIIDNFINDKIKKGNVKRYSINNKNNSIVLYIHKDGKEEIVVYNQDDIINSFILEHKNK